MVTKTDQAGSGLVLTPKVLLCMSLGVLFSAGLGVLYGLGFGDVLYGVAFFGAPFAIFLCWGLGVYFSQDDEPSG